MKRAGELTAEELERIGREELFLLEDIRTDTLVQST